MVAYYLMTLVLAATDPTCAGAVTSCEGSAELVRGGQHYRLVHGASIELGDQILCGEKGRVVIYLTEGQSIMLASGTHVQYDKASAMTLSKGEARVTSDGWPEFEIRAGGESLHLGRGVARVQTHAGRNLWRLEYGDGSLTTTDGQQLALDAVQHPSTAPAQADGGEAPGDRWAIRAAAYQRTAVQQVAPRIEPPADLRDPSPTPAQDSQEAGRALGEDAAEEDEEDRLPRRSAPEPVLPPAPEVARGGEVDDGRRDLDASSNVSSATFGSFSSFSLGSFSGSTASFGSGGLFADAAQSTLEGSLTRPFNGLQTGDPFPGNIHLLTAENEYRFDGVELTPGEQASLFPTADRYFSIGVGTPPNSQVTTNVTTGTGPDPSTIEIPGFNHYLIELDQYGIPDPAKDPAAAAASNIGVTGLLGTDPSSPTILGATPLLDERAEINEQATFALGEFRVASVNGDGISFGIRRSDQDRTIVKDPGFNDANDLVTPNSQVSEFDDVADPRFQPAAPTVKVPTPGAFDADPNRFRNLDTLRRAATTTLVADQLYEYSRRTGQTRFVVDGRIIDISGYQR